MGTWKRLNTNASARSASSSLCAATDVLGNITDVSVVNMNECRGWLFLAISSHYPCARWVSAVHVKHCTCREIGLKYTSCVREAYCVQMRSLERGELVIIQCVLGNGLRL